MGKRYLGNFDISLLTAVLIIAVVGILAVYSASASFEAGKANIYIKQIIWFITGFILALIFLFFDYRNLELYAYPLYIIFVLLLLVVLAIGKVASGAQRWLNFGFFAFQPSEFMKLVIVITLAKYFHNRVTLDGFNLFELIIPFILIFLPAGLIIVQPDLGTAMILIAVSFSILFFIKIRFSTLLTLIITGLLAAPFLWQHLKEYQKKRILTFLNPELDPLGAGYHIMQSKIAVGSGKFFGKGFLKGTQNQLHFLPEHHTDFIFSVITEEFGFIGSFLIISLYLFIILWSLRIAQNAKDKYGTILAYGIAALFFWQAGINIGMVTGMLPVVGVPLPLLSYGGSAVITNMLAVGILLNISMRRFMF